MRANGDGLARCDRCGEEPGRANDEMRCSCGSLLARLVRGGVELKCRRCKRTVLLPLEGSLTAEVSGGGASFKSASGSSPLE